jgi:hypothetical protein
MGEKRKKYLKFGKRVGLLVCIEVWELGFEDNDGNGWFPPEKIPMLMKFCEHNPEFHIISRIGKILHNQYIPGFDRYFLGNGDKTANISVEVNNDYSEEELLELEQSKAFTEFREMQVNRSIPRLDELFPKRKIH